MTGHSNPWGNLGRWVRRKMLQKHSPQNALSPKYYTQNTKVSYTKPPKYYLNIYTQNTIGPQNTYAIKYQTPKCTHPT